MITELLALTLMTPGSLKKGTIGTKIFKLPFGDELYSEPISETQAKDIAAICHFSTGFPQAVEALFRPTTGTHSLTEIRLAIELPIGWLFIDKFEKANLNGKYGRFDGLRFEELAHKNNWRMSPSIITRGQELHVNNLIVETIRLFRRDGSEIGKVAGGQTKIFRMPIQSVLMSSDSGDIVRISEARDDRFNPLQFGVSVRKLEFKQKLISSGGNVRWRPWQRIYVSVSVN